MNQDNMGHVTIITRMGVSAVQKVLPGLIQAGGGSDLASCWNTLNWVLVVVVIAIVVHPPMMGAILLGSLALLPPLLMLLLWNHPAQTMSESIVSPPLMPSCISEL